MKILWIPHTGWHIPQRAHLFCRLLAERHEVHVTDWVADFASPHDYFSRRYLRNFFYLRYNDHGITVHGIPRVSPALFLAPLRRLNTAIFSKHVNWIIKTYGIEVVVGTFVVPPPRVPWLVFDLFDDNPVFWREYRCHPRYADEIARVESEYLQKADQVIAVSSVLRDRAAQRRITSKTGGVHLIPNGVDLSHYREADGELIRQQLGLTNYKVIGLISALGEFTGVLRLVKAFEHLSDPHVALLVVGDGPQLELARRWVQAHRLERVFFTGRVPFSEVAQYHKALDVGVLPFDKTPFTDAACPIKLLEYTAAGKVVVSTNLTEVRRMAFPNVLLVEPTESALADGLRTAMQTFFLPPPNLAEYDAPQLVERFEILVSQKAT